MTQSARLEVIERRAGDSRGQAPGLTPAQPTDERGALQDEKEPHDGAVPVPGAHGRGRRPVRGRWGYTAALLGPAIYSIVDSPRAARRHDRRARELQLLLTPAPMAGPDRSSGLGLYLGGRF